MTAKRELIGIRIDIETRSRVDLRKSGVYPYVECPDHKVLVIAYKAVYQQGKATLLGKTRLLDQTDRGAVKSFTQMLRDPRFQKHAYNAQFERVNLSRWVGLPQGEYLDPKGWYCTAIAANTNGIFGSLDDVAKNLRSPIVKDPVGKRLIDFFSKPDKKTGEFNEPVDFPEKFKQFEDYCVRDVDTEAEVAGRLVPIRKQTQREYEHDQRINDRGFWHDADLSLAAVAQVEAEKTRIMTKLAKMTGISNPNSIQQMQAWLASQDYGMTSLDKASREAALADPRCPKKVKKVLTLKGAASLSSVAKHKAALATRCADGRIRGSLQFHGAHTGREAGRGIQPQNLPRYEAPEKDIARLRKGKAGKDAPEIAKGSVRASIRPRPGHVFVVYDYNAIEARVLAGLAGEQWAQEEFRGDGAIYEATASTMFGVDKATLMADLTQCGKCGKETCTACSLRNRGKVSTLALGYAGGPGALVVMGAERAGVDIGNFKTLQEEYQLAAPKNVKFHEWERDRHDYPDLIRLRDLYRDASPETVRFWKLCGVAWDLAAMEGKATSFGQDGCVTIMRDGPHNKMVLPSGRAIWYRYAKSHLDGEDRLGNPRVDRRTFIGKATGVGHTRVDTHGGKLTENVTQAVARDALFDLITKVEKMTKKGWPGRIVLHVHDEVVLEVPEKHADRVESDMRALMAESPAWAPFIITRGAGGIMTQYGK